jgi:hemin uptake protein HemP
VDEQAIPPGPAVDSAAGDEVSSPSPQRRPVPSSTLLQGARVVEIDHNGEIYRLQATRLGKLILTK